MGWKRSSALGGVMLSVACSSSTFDVAPAGDGAVDSSTGSDTAGGDSSVTIDSNGGDSTPGDSTPADSATTDGTAGDTRSDAPLCDPSSFPTLDRRCGS